MPVAPVRAERTIRMSLRWRLGRMALSVAAFGAGLLLVVPKGLSVFAVALGAATLLALPDAIGRTREMLPATIRWLLGVACVVLVATGASAMRSGAGWEALDNPSRVVLLPWCAWLAWIYRLPASRLGGGALAGLVVAGAMSTVQASQGIGRAGGGINAIVFANAVLTLLVLAVFCRPAMTKLATRWLLAAAVAVAAVTIVLSGSRGVLPGLGLVLVVLLAGDRAGRWRRVAGASVLLLSASLLVWNVSWLASKLRLDDVQGEVARYAAGEVDTPVGARLALWGVAWRAFRESPVSGVGIDGVEARIDASAHCRAGPRHFCELNHAHNDLAQWAAAMGIAGIGALLALYVVPLVLAVRRVRTRAMPAGDDAARACAVLIVVYVISGLTQSMFAHALSASAYAIFVGLLLGTPSMPTAPGARAAPH